MKSIIRNTEEVQALLNGGTQFRVPIKINPNKFFHAGITDISLEKQPLQVFLNKRIEHGYEYKRCAFEVGDEVFVKEKFCELYEKNKKLIAYKNDNRFDYIDYSIKWKPSIHMKQEQSRFTLKITNVRVERLEDISFVDILEMGAPNPELKNDADMFEFKANTEKIRKWFIDFWDSSAKDGFTFEDNPYVFVYDFEIVKGK